MTSNEVIRKLYKELQECRRNNERLKEKVKELEKNLDEKNKRIETLLETVELVLGEEI
jgi:predicted transcriptional regulator